MVEVEFGDVNHRPHGAPASGDMPSECPAGQWMPKTTMDLTELLQKHDQGDVLRAIAQGVLQRMMESDVDGLIGGGRQHGRPPRDHRSGHRSLGARDLLDRVLAPFWAL